MTPIPLRPALLMLLTLAVSSNLSAVDTSWNSTGTASWGDTANWSNGVPGSSDRALIQVSTNSDITTTLQLDGNRVLDRLQVQTKAGNTGRVLATLDGTGGYSLTLNTSATASNAAEITFDTDLVLSGSTTKYFSANDTSLITLASGHTLSGLIGKNGTGTLTINSSSFNATAGSIALRLDGGTVNWNPGSVSTNATSGQYVMYLSGINGAATLNFETSFNTTGYIRLGNNSGLDTDASRTGNVSVFGTANGVVIANDLRTDQTGVNTTLGTSTFVLGANDTTATALNTSKVTFSGNYAITDGAITQNARTHQFFATADNTAEFTGAITGGTSGITTLQKTGTGTVVFAGTTANTVASASPFEVKEGILVLQKTAGINALPGNVRVDSDAILRLGASNQIADTAGLVLDGGTFDAATFSETLGTLTLTADSTISLGTGASLSFADSSGLWDQSISLTIVGTLGETSLRFGTTSSGLDANQLSSITFADQPGFIAALNAAGYLTATAIPEPASAALLAGFAFLAIATAGRRNPRA